MALVEIEPKEAALIFNLMKEKGNDLDEVGSTFNLSEDALDDLWDNMETISKERQYESVQGQR